MHAHQCSFFFAIYDTPSSNNDSLNVTVEGDEETDSLNVTMMAPCMFQPLKERLERG